MEKGAAIHEIAVSTCLRSEVTDICIRVYLHDFHVPTLDIALNPQESSLRFSNSIDHAGSERLLVPVQWHRSLLRISTWCKSDKVATT